MQENKSNSGTAKLFGWIVYGGAIIAATLLFLTFVLTAFPEDAYFSRFVMSIAGLAVGASMIAFPIALNNWAIEKRHRMITTILYYIEMVFIAVNTVVSFVTLLAKYTDFKAPEWTVLYEPFSVLSIVYVIFAWGTIHRFDPEGERRAKEQQFEQDYETAIAQRKMDFIHSIEGDAAIAHAASADIEEMISRKRGRKHFGGNIPAPPPFIRGDIREGVPRHNTAHTDGPASSGGDFHPEG